MKHKMMMISNRSTQKFFLLILLQGFCLHYTNASWPLFNFSDVQLLHLFPYEQNAPTPAIHSQAMFKAATLLSIQYNITTQGQFITGHIADTTGTQINAIDVACKAISTSNIVSIVGPRYSRETPMIAALGERVGIPVISYAATDPDLSDRKAYPALYRTVPTDGAAALAIAQLFLRYNWTSCIIIYQNDAFGTGGVQAITDVFSKNGLKVVNTLAFDIITGRLQNNLRDVLIISPTRIVVLWMISAYSTSVLQEALNSDVLGPNYVWILSASVDLSYFNHTSYSKLIGMITVEPTVASVTNAPSNTTLLNAALDLWKQYEPETFPGSNNVDYYALFAFDAAWTLIQSLSQLCATTNTTSHCISPTNTTYCFERHVFNSKMIFDIINNMTFLGVSGHIQFDSSTTDRINGSYYVLKNAQSFSDGMSFVQVLSYSDGSGWTSNANTQVIWPGNSLVMPTGGAKLEGIKLKLGLIPTAHFTNVVNTKDAFGNKTSTLIGYIPDLLNLLQAQLKFIPDIEITLATRTYSDFINDVAIGAYDLVLGDVTITSGRREKVDFSSSIFDNSLRLMVRKELAMAAEPFSFVKPLSWTVWLLIVGIVTLASISICVLERGANEDFQHRSLISLCGTGIWFGCCNFMGRHVELHVRSGPGRFLLIGLFFSSLVIVASYTANLASELTISKPKSFISGIDDIKSGKVPSNRIGIRVGSAMAEYYLNEISAGVPNYHPVFNSTEMYNGLLSNVIDVVLLDGGFGKYITNNVYCNLTLIGEEFNKGSFGIVMRKGWLYAKDLDVALLSIRESGGLEELYRKWFQVKTCPDDPVSSNAIEVRSLIGFFLLYGFIYAISLSLFAWRKFNIGKSLSAFLRRMAELLRKK